MNYDLYWVWLSRALGTGAKCLDLISYYEWDPYAIYGTGFNEIYSLDIITKRQLEKLKKYPIEEAQKILDDAKNNGWKVITPTSEYYPQRLLTLQDLPLVLFVQGDETVLKNELMISVVGARKASEYGNAVARALSSAMTSMDFTIVSGGALGIDSSAHKGALDEKGKTVCVLGCGLGTKYLMENASLREKISENGAVISEYPPFSKATPETFPLRNRIISGMSLGTVVVEAGEKSGSLITARLALEQGRDVFAVPGDLVSSSFLGTNNLIRNGATPVFSPNDILEAYYNRYSVIADKKERLPDDEVMKRAQGYLTGKPKKEEKKTTAKPEPPAYLTENARKIYEFIGCEPTHIDIIITGCQMSTAKTLSAITELEIYGLVTQISGRRYRINQTEK